MAKPTQPRSGSLCPALQEPLGRGRMVGSRGRPVTSLVLQSFLAEVALGCACQVAEMEAHGAPAAECVHTAPAALPITTSQVSFQTSVHQSDSCCPPDLWPYFLLGKMSSGGLCLSSGEDVPPAPSFRAVSRGAAVPPLPSLGWYQRVVRSQPCASLSSPFRSQLLRGCSSEAAAVG